MGGVCCSAGGRMGCLESMVRLWPRFAVLCALLFVGWFSSSAHAMFPKQSVPHYYDGDVYLWNAPASSPQIVADAWFAKYPTSKMCFNYMSSYTSGPCDKSWTAVFTSGYNSKAQTVYNYGSNGLYSGYSSKTIYQDVSLTCPANSTLSGTQCACDAGYKEQLSPYGDYCVLDEPPAPVYPCAWAENLVMYAGGTFSIERDKKACFNGCEFALRPDAGFALESSRLSADSPWFDVRTVPDFAGTGQVCDPLTTGASSGTTEPTPYPPGEDGVPPPDACPKDQVPGTVNGVSMCVNPGIREVKSTTSSTNDDGTNTTEKIEDKQTTCVGETCTTTATTVTNVTNNSTSTVTSSTNTRSETTTKGEYCKANPYDKLCTADGQGAVSGDCSELDKGCTDKLGNLEPETFSNTNRAMSITAQSGWGEGAGSCPAPRVVNVAGISLEMPFDLLCDFAAGIRPIIIALAWLSAALAFLGLSKRD